MSAATRFRIVFGLALASGFAALAHELLWTRRLIDLLGASTESTSRVFGFFFLGLAIGSAIAARFIGRLTRPWRAVALAEIGVAVFAIPMLFLPQWSAWVWPTLGMDRLVHWPGLVVKTIISAAVILPPAICMGLVLPLMCHGLLRWTHRLESDGVRLYAINTLGGAAGLLAAAIGLLPLFGAIGSMVCAMVLNGIVAAGALVLDKLSGAKIVPDGQSGHVDAPETKPLPWPILVAACLSAVGILAAEIIANQMFMLVATMSFYAPAAILFAVIVSLAAGAFLAERLRQRTVEVPYPVLIGTVMGLTALALAAGPLVFMGIAKHVDLLELNGSVGGFVIKLVLLAMSTLGPGFLLAGLVFPLTISWLAEEAGDRDGKRLGWLLAVNGLGGVIGAEMAYRILLPLFDVHTALGTVAIGYALAGLAFSWRSNRKVSEIKFQAGALVAVALIIVFGLQQLPVVSKRFGIKLLDHRSGREGSVAVIGERDGVNRCIVMDNQYLLGGSGTRVVEERQATLPLLLHPAPKNIAFIGLATGITPGAALQHSNVDSTTIVELSPLVERAADRFFSEFNHNITHDKRTTIIIDDGRTVISAVRGQFDMVIGDLFLPWAPGEGRLYSVEHFRDVRRSLRPGGVFCQWLAMYQLTPSQFEIIAATFREVFPHTYCFCSTLDSERPALALVGFQGDQELNWQDIAACCTKARKNDTLNRDPLVREIAGVADLYLGEWKPDAWKPPVPINTLGNLLIELDAGRERLTVSPATEYLYGRRWLKFCHQCRAKMIADGLPMNSPLTMSSLERVDRAMNQVDLMQSRAQSP